MIGFYAYNDKRNDQSEPRPLKFPDDTLIIRDIAASDCGKSLGANNLNADMGVSKRHRNGHFVNIVSVARDVAKLNFDLNAIFPKIRAELAVAHRIIRVCIDY